MNNDVSTLRILRSSSLPGAIQQEICRMILDGTFEPGDKLGEAELALQLGVSRGPIREAFRGLEEAKLVRFTRNRGVYVREISIPEATEIYTVRAGLDDLIGRILAPQITEGQISELQGRIVAMERCYSSGNIQEYFSLNMSFHDRIAEMAGNQKLLEIYRRLMNETLLIRRRGLTRGGGFSVSNQEHQLIVDALATKDPDRAALAMTEHVRRGQERLMKSLQVPQPANTATA